MAAQRGVFLELSARRGHSLCNGRVAAIGSQAGASLILNSDAHAPEDLLTEEIARQIARGTGLEREALDAVLETSPKKLLEKLGFSFP